MFVGNSRYYDSFDVAESYLEKQTLPQGLVLEELAEIGIESHDWFVLGCLATIRYEMETSIGLMALDESHYFDHTDYELELEVTDHEKGKRDFQQFLSENNITYQKAPSKLIRFIKSMKKS